jgi:UDP-N-acetylmuramoyl-tripeptide--D-alanyl-D-alanine ligase
MNSLLTLFLESTGVCTDTRKILHRNIFFALKGEKFNGNLYASEAIQKGASYSIVDEDLGWNDERYIRVDNVLKALQVLANDYRNFLGLPVLAITGSNGKTTSKELIANVLQNKFNLNYTQGNLNNEIGVPLTILSTNQKHNFLITEMGANHQGEIALLCEIAEPNYGLITNIGKAHLEGFGGEEGVKKGKGELYRFLERTDNKVFLNTADSMLTSIAPTHNLIPYSVNDFILVNHEPYLVIRHNETGAVINSHLAGIYNISNIATAYAIGRYFDVSEEEIVHSISSYIPSNNRSEISEYKGVKIIKDAYNANPSSVHSSLNSFLSSAPGDKIVILGDMLELGEYSFAEHKAVLELLKSKGVYKCILVGPHYIQLQEVYPFEFFNSTQEAKSNIDWNEFHGKSVLIKGSRGIALEQLLDS